MSPKAPCRAAADPSSAPAPTSAGSGSVPTLLQVAWALPSERAGPAEPPADPTSAAVFLQNTGGMRARAPAMARAQDCGHGDMVGRKVAACVRNGGGWKDRGPRLERAGCLRAPAQRTYSPLPVGK